MTLTPTEVQALTRLGCPPAVLDYYNERRHEMTERTDHAAKAREWLKGAERPDLALEETRTFAEIAHTHATLALVDAQREANEQARIANLIALFHRDPEKLTGGAASDFANEAWDHLADVPIRTALGLEGAQA